MRTYGINKKSNHCNILVFCFIVLMTTFGSSPAGFCTGISEAIPLWPNGAPGETGAIGREVDTDTPTNRLVAGRKMIRLSNVSQPTITLYHPSKDKDTGAAVVVCPGGSYSILAMDLEGTEVCQWLNSIGVTGVLLKYRVPKRPGDDHHLLPFQDVQRAFGLVRSRAPQWNLDPKRIGILGFSAGGHLAARLSNNFDRRVYEYVDDADQASCRPDFTVLIYPAYLVLKDQNALAPEFSVTTNTPPTFLTQTEDDPIGVDNSLCYYLALKKAGVPVEMHLYATGGHGYGMRLTEKSCTGWPDRAEEWLRATGVLAKKRP